MHRKSPPRGSAAPSALATLALIATALPAPAVPARSEVDRALEEWRAAHGEAWQLSVDQETSFGEFLHGPPVPPAYVPTEDEEWVDVARAFVRQAADMLGMDDSHLERTRVVFLPLSLIDSSDKITVRFQQSKDGIPVRGGSVNVLMDAFGGLLSVASTAAPDLGRFDTTPSVSRESASALASARFRDDTGRSASHVREPNLVFVQVEQGGRRHAVLAWEVVVGWDDEGGEEMPLEYIYAFNAATGEWISRTDAMQYFDVTGSVQAKVSPIDQPLIAGAPAIVVPMKRLEIWDGADQNLLTTTDENGDFVISNPEDPPQVTLRFEGPTVPRVDNWSFSDYRKSVTLDLLGPNDILLNDTGSSGQVGSVTDTAQANCFYWTSYVREWIETTIPSSPSSIWLTFPTDKPKQTPNAQPVQCNAHGNAVGSGVLYWRGEKDCDGAGPCTELCGNMARATVIFHEMGHLLNYLYTLAIPGGAFEEGRADVWARFVRQSTDPPESNCPAYCWKSRSGTNARKWCGEFAQPEKDDHCYDEHHKAGEVLLGAFWKMRQRLIATNPIGGEQAANLLFLSWLEVYDDMEIDALVQKHLLVLDDDDGNSLNGGPHWADIDRAFVGQGFPVLWDGFQFSNVVDPGITSNENGPYSISVDVKALFKGPIQDVTLHWSIDGGDTFNDVTMTSSTGITWTANITQGQSAPAMVQYYFSATDSTGTGQTAEFPVQVSVQLDGRLDGSGIDNWYDPEHATPEYLRFFVGVEEEYFWDDLEGSISGWSPGGTIGNDWEVGTPQGLGQPSIPENRWSDPAAAYSGSVCWGNDLGLGGAADGAYVDQADNWLDSPEIQLVGAEPNERLFVTFQRWLTVDRKKFQDDLFPSDRAELGVVIEVDEEDVVVPVWWNHEWVPHVDADSTTDLWTRFEVEVTEALENNEADHIHIRWSLNTDGDSSRQPLGGWNVDDIRVFAIQPN